MNDNSGNVHRHSTTHLQGAGIEHFLSQWVHPVVCLKRLGNSLEVKKETGPGPLWGPGPVR
jgi:hypothetical protein